MSENKNTVDQFLTEAKTLEGRRQELIRSLLNQRETAIRDYDSQLAKLGHKPETHRRSHHKKHSDGAPIKLSPPSRPSEG